MFAYGSVTSHCPLTASERSASRLSGNPDPPSSSESWIRHWYQVLVTRVANGSGGKKKREKSRDSSPKADISTKPYKRKKRLKHPFQTFCQLRKVSIAHVTHNLLPWILNKFCLLSLREWSGDAANLVSAEVNKPTAAAVDSENLSEAHKTLICN